MRALLPVPLAGLLLAACGADPPVLPNAPSVRDSAGIRIVEHPGDLPASPVELELVWEHGHAPSDYAFQSVFRGGIRPDGSVVLGDGGNQEVVVIGSSGSRHEVVASAGEGPGEVLMPRMIEIESQDVFWVEDPRNGKLLRFDGTEVTDVVSTRAEPTVARALMPIGLDTQGDFLMATSSYRSDFEVPWLAGHVVRWGRDTGSLDTLASYDMAVRPREVDINPFLPHGIATGAGSGFVHARSDVAEITWRDEHGAIRQIVRWTPTPGYPNQDAWEGFEARMRADLVRVNPTMDRDRLQQFVDEQIDRYTMDPTSPLPLFGWLSGADNGEVWLSEYVPEAGLYVARYRVISAEGETVGVVDFGRPMQLLDVADGKALGVFTDELDVQAAALYRYRMPS